MTNFEQAMFWIMGALVFLAFSPVDKPGGMVVAGLGAMACATAGIVLLLRECRK